jgi:ketosteroid isomerase-like protein
VHDEMTTEEMTLRVYGDTAVTIARGVSGGTYEGRRFRETERSSCVFIRQHGEWRCVLTHLSRLASP